MMTRTPRWAVRCGTAGVTVALTAAGLAGLAGTQGVALAARGTLAPSGSSGTAPVSRSAATANPYSPATHHPYRHGVLPTIGRERQIRAWARHAAGTRAAGARGASSPLNLSYGGGVHGIGVTTGHEKVYLVFWGSQWGRKSVGAHGDVTLAGDPSGAAPYLQQLFKGLGTGGETWSGVMTQYCDGVRYNALSCPATARHVGYPTGGALAGVWVDERIASPANASGNQLGAEAIAAARHFGNTTNGANRNAQYDILSPTGTHPDGFNTPNGQFCAWHDDTADPTLPSGPVNSPLDVAFTNMPYVTDLGISCGQNFVNSGSAGLLDGVSIVNGHEYAETITDQLPPFGWTNYLTGGENGDLCAWNQTGISGGTNDLVLPTGTFAMQSTWSNDLYHVGGCEFSHRVVTSK
jgi:hypothetical protein